MAKRHGGIVTLGVLGVLFGLVGLCYNGFLLTTLLLLKASSSTLDGATVQALSRVNGLVLLSIGVNAVTGLAVFVAGIGLFLLHAWARIGYVAAAAITVVNRLLTFPMHLTRDAVESGSGQAAAQAANQAGAMAGDLVAILFNLFAVWFLSRASIKALFKQT